MNDDAVLPKYARKAVAPLCTLVQSPCDLITLLDMNRRTIPLFVHRCTDDRSSSQDVVCVAQLLGVPHLVQALSRPDGGGIELQSDRCSSRSMTTMAAVKRKAKEEELCRSMSRIEMKMFKKRKCLKSKWVSRVDCAPSPRLSEQYGGGSREGVKSVYRDGGVARSSPGLCIPC